MRIASFEHARKPARIARAMIVVSMLALAPFRRCGGTELSVLNRERLPESCVFLTDFWN
jgi:hypothetical protein